MQLLQIILTHEHADAVLGLDDIRAVQPFSPTNDINPTPIYLTQDAMERYSAFAQLFIHTVIELVRFSVAQFLLLDQQDEMVMISLISVLP